MKVYAKVVVCGIFPPNDTRGVGERGSGGVVVALADIAVRRSMPRYQGRPPARDSPGVYLRRLCKGVIIID